MQDEESTLKFDLKKDWLAAIVGVIGLVLLVVGILGATVFRPADHVTASGTTSAPAKAVFTRGGLLGLYKTPVTITAKAEGNEKLTMVVGRSYDVSAFAASMNAAEIKGLIDIETLEVADPATLNRNVTPEPVSVSESDLWDQTVLGNGEVVLTLEDLAQDPAVMVVATDKEVQYTVTLSWKYRVVTYWQWVVLGFGILFLVAAGFVFWWMRRYYRDSEELGVSTNEGDTHLDAAKESLPVPDTASSALEAELSEAALDGSDESLTDSAEETDEDSTLETAVSGDETHLDADRADESSPVSGEEVPEGSEPHRQAVETTESGRILAITTATGQIRIPTRGALRTARERGEARMEIDGVVYETGVIPAVHVEKVEDDPVEQLHVPEDSSAEVEKMINEAKAAGQKTGVRPGESLWERLRRYRSDSSPTQNEVEGDSNE